MGLLLVSARIFVAVFNRVFTIIFVASSIVAIMLGSILWAAFGPRRKDPGQW